MKALQFTSSQPIGNNPLQVAEINLKQPLDKDVLIQIHTCGMCRTDLHIIEGEIAGKKSPLVPGHQIVGIVKRFGKNVTNLKFGDRVGVTWLNSSCGVCEYCKRGEENLCDQAKFTGYDVDGGYAEQILVSSDFIVPIPFYFSDEEAAPLLCGGVVGYRALKMSNIKPGERLGLFGFGSSAHLAIQVARHWKCEVYVFTRSDKHRKLAEELGATWTGTADDNPPQTLDGAISFAPAGDVVPKALRHLRKGGTLALASIYMTPIPSFEYPLLYQERIIRSVANATRQDANEFLKLAADIHMKVHVETFPFEEANHALQFLKVGGLSAAGVLKIASGQQ